MQFIIIFKSFEAQNTNIMDQQQDVKFTQPAQPSHQRPLQTSKDKISPFKDEYLKYMNYKDAELMHDQLIRKLKRHHIFQETGNDQLISIVNVIPSKYCEIVEVDVKLGRFLLRIRIINIRGQSPVHCCECIGVGGFGKIYKYSSSDSSKAVKCLQAQSSEHLKTHLFFAIAEYGFLKISSIIDNGPETKINGFDIYVYKNERKTNESDQVCNSYCIEFQMECCSFETSFTPSDSQSLFRSLSCLHQLGIAHCDIKPHNIMYSFAKKKWVFIDFGITTGVNEPIGQRTLTKYRGTFKYSGQQMKRLYSRMLAEKFNDLQDYIDLYWNDVHGLRMSCEDLQEKKNQSNEQLVNLIKYNDREIEQHFLVLDFKYCLYFTNEFQEQFYMKNIAWDQTNRLDMVYFLFEIQFLPEKIRTIFKDFLKPHEIPGIQHSIFQNVLAEVKSTLNYDESLMEMHQQQLKPKYLYFQQIPSIIKTCKASVYKLPSIKAAEDNQMQNVSFYLKNYQYSGDSSEYCYYMAILFDSVNFLKNKYSLNIQDKIEVCKAFYQLNNKNSQQLKNGLAYIQYFIESVINICLLQSDSLLKEKLVEVYANYLILGSLNPSIIKKVYASTIEVGSNLPKVCSQFLQIYNLNFWIQEQMFGNEGFDYMELKQYILSIMAQICQRLQCHQDQSHGHCDKSQHVCMQLQESMLKTIERYASFISNKKSNERSFELKIARCLQTLKLFKIAYDQSKELNYGIKEIPIHLKDFYIWEFYMLNPQSWARITYHIRKFIDCSEITNRFSFILKMEAFYKLYQTQIHCFLREFEDTMCVIYPGKNVQRMRAYYQMIICEIYSQQKTMSFVQDKRDNFIKESLQVFEELGNHFEVGRLATLLLKMGQFDSRFIWFYLQLIKTLQMQRVLQILHIFKDLLDVEACLVKKQHKLLKLTEFIIRNDITLLNLQINNQSFVLQYQQSYQLLEIKLKFLEKTIIISRQNWEQKTHYLFLFYQIIERNDRYIDFLVKNIDYSIYLDLISLLISSQRSEQAVKMIYKLSQNLLYLLSKQTSILSKKIKDLIFDIFITQRSQNFKHWTLFRYHFLQRQAKQTKNFLVFYNITIGLIDQAAYQLAKSFQERSIPMLTLPVGFVFLDRTELKGLLIRYSRLLNYQIPVYQVYQRENYYRLVSFLIFCEEKHGPNKARYKQFIARLHLKALLMSFPFDLSDLFKSKKHLIVRKKHYHIIINIHQGVPYYNRSTQTKAKEKYTQKIDQFIKPYQEIIIKRVKINK